MPRELITVQVGQCGNQIGMRWWDVMLQEHQANTQYADAQAAVFDHVESGPRGGGNLRARCVAVDMEEGVLSSMTKGPLRNLFDDTFFVSDVSGAGNNWAVGHMGYGDQYIDAIADAVRGQVERCESVQSFLVMHSLSGGTGSGLGTRVLGMLEEEFPHIFRLSPVVLPATVDDVVTAPYNTCFALKEIIEHSDCAFPVDNDALGRMADRAMGKTTGKHSNNCGGLAMGESGVPQATSFNAAKPTQTKGLPYDTINALVAQMLSNLTCAMRFPGPLNMDINEITTNLVPYPRLHLITSSLAPLRVTKHTTVGPRTVDAMVAACLEKEHQFVGLSDGSTTSGTSLATALIARGPQITVGDLTRSVSRLHDKLRLPYWNTDGFKTALCGVSPLGHKDSMLMLSNNCAITGKVEEIFGKFMRLYSVRSHVHHYEEYLSPTYFDCTADTIRTMVEDYQYLATAKAPRDLPRSMKDLVVY